MEIINRLKWQGGFDDDRDGSGREGFKMEKVMKSR